LFDAKTVGHRSRLRGRAEEVMSKAEGVGGEVDYVLRRVDVSIDSHTLTVPIAWLQTDDTVECLLGREVVFDNFDIEFKQPG
jgi:hypothetical protein